MYPRLQYTGGQKVTYNGHLWTAKWWTQGDTPGGNDYLRYLIFRFVYSVPLLCHFLQVRLGSGLTTAPAPQSVDEGRPSPSIVVKVPRPQSRPSRYPQEQGSPTHAFFASDCEVGLLRGT